MILGVALVFRTPPDSRGGAVDFAAAALAGTMASPIAWEHHYGLLLPIFAMLLPLVWTRPWFGAVGLPVLALLYVISSNCFHITTRLADTWANFLQPYLYGAALGLFAFLLIVRAKGAEATTRET